MTHSPYPVVLDACVIYPNMLRDLLMRLGLSGLYQPKWTALIHDEWQRNLVKNMPEVNPEKVKHVEVLMNRALPDALVTGFEPMIAGLSLPDVDDRHVVAAAMKCNAEVIVTFNLKDFPPESLDALEIEAMHPDEFILDLIDLNLALVLQSARTQRTSLKNPPMDADQYLASLLKLGLPLTVRALEGYRFMI